MQIGLFVIVTLVFRLPRFKGQFVDSVERGMNAGFFNFYLENSNQSKMFYYSEKIGKFAEIFF